jgi:hypothetical protein
MPTTRFCMTNFMPAQKNAKRKTYYCSILTARVELKKIVFDKNSSPDHPSPNFPDHIV